MLVLVFPSQTARGVSKHRLDTTCLSLSLLPPLYFRLLTSNSLLPPLDFRLFTSASLLPPLYFRLFTSATLLPPLYFRLFTSASLLPPLYFRLFTVLPPLYFHPLTSASLLPPPYFRLLTSTFASLLPPFYFRLLAFFASIYFRSYFLHLLSLHICMGQLRYCRTTSFMMYPSQHKIAVKSCSVLHTQTCEGVFSAFLENIVTGLVQHSFWLYTYTADPFSWGKGGSVPSPLWILPVTLAAGRGKGVGSLYTYV
jgi:hypothetical protein